MLPEAPDKNYGWHMRKKKGTILAKERISFTFSSDRWVENTYVFLAAGVHVYVACWLTFPLVAAVSVTSNP